MLVFSNYPKNYARKIYKSLVTGLPGDQPPCGSMPKTTAVYETNQRKVPCVITIIIKIVLSPLLRRFFNLLKFGQAC